MGEEFVSRPSQNKWSEDSGFSIDVDAAVIQDPSLFELLNAPRASSDPLDFELRWLAPTAGESPMLRDLDTDFSRLFGRFAEEQQYIQRSVSSDRVTYSVLIGSDGHRHDATFIVTGSPVIRMIEAYERVARKNRQSPRSP